MIVFSPKDLNKAEQEKKAQVIARQKLREQLRVQVQVQTESLAMTKESVSDPKSSKRKVYLKKVNFKITVEQENHPLRPVSWSKNNKKIHFYAEVLQ